MYKQYSVEKQSHSNCDRPSRDPIFKKKMAIAIDISSTKSHKYIVKVEYMYVQCKKEKKQLM